MKAMILAAGRGSRLEKFTDDKPKCLLEVKGKPILYWQLKALCENHIRDVTLVIGYKAELVKEYIYNKWPKLNTKFVINEDWKTTNSAYSAHLANMNSPYVHINCDLIFDGGLLRTLIDLNINNIIAIDKKINLTDNMEQVFMDIDNRILQMDNKRFLQADGKAVGLAIISKDVVDRIDELTADDIIVGKLNENFFGKLREVVKTHFIYGACVYDGIYEINTKKDFYNFM